jgi:hypothetical protein
VNIKTFCAIATVAGATLAMSPDARADFLVICPTGGFTAAWSHTGGTQFDFPISFDSSKQLLIPPTRFLTCRINADFNLSVSYPTPGVCGGTVSMFARSAVFGRPELFQSFAQPASAFTDGQVCTLEADVSFLDVTVVMSENCESRNDGQGWDCPDSASQVVPEFGGAVAEAPSE